MARKSEVTRAPIAAALASWYRAHQRDLPWRRRHDPYAVWVSEIMLQQTRVATVVDYYDRFLSRFPDVAVLAAAPLDDVLKAWEGMGYYGRARNLHAAAGQVVERFDGELPSDPKQLRSLPGIGAYTAGAIASIAFDLDEPVLDGNVERVLSRIYGIAEDVKAVKTHKHLWRLARELIPPGQASTFNQATMDLGATLCTPTKPNCLICPLRDHCAARAAGNPEKLPVKPAKKPLPHHTVVAAVIRRGAKLLIDRRKPDGLLGGLWEFPGGKVEPDETHEAALIREVREELGIVIRVKRPLVTVRHAYTHFRITLHAFECTHASGRARPLECDEVRWVTVDRLGEFAFPKANHRIIAAIREEPAKS